MPVILNFLLGFSFLYLKGECTEGNRFSFITTGADGFCSWAVLPTTTIESFGRRQFHNIFMRLIHCCGRIKRKK